MGFGRKVGKNGGRKGQQSQRPIHTVIGQAPRSQSHLGGGKGQRRRVRGHLGKCKGKGKGKSGGSVCAEQWLVVPWREWFRDAGYCLYIFPTQEELQLLDVDFIRNKFGALLEVDHAKLMVKADGTLLLLPGAYKMSTRSTADLFVAPTCP